MKKFPFVVILFICFVNDALNQVEISIVENKTNPAENIVENMIINNIFDDLAKTLEEDSKLNKPMGIFDFADLQPNKRSTHTELDDVIDGISLLGNNKFPAPRIFRDEQPMIFVKKNLKGSQDPLDNFDIPMKIFSQMDEVMNDFLMHEINQDKESHHKKHKTHHSEHDKTSSHSDSHKKDNGVKVLNVTQAKKKVPVAKIEHGKSQKKSPRNANHNHQHKNHTTSSNKDTNPFPHPRNSSNSFMSLLIYLIILLILFFVFKNIFSKEQSKETYGRSINNAEEEFRGLKS